MSTSLFSSYNKSKLYFLKIIILSIFLAGGVQAMDEDCKIEFQGQKKRAMGFVNSALFEPDTDPFSTTHVFRYKKEDKKLSKIGMLWDMSEEDLTEIITGNFAYTENYTLDKTHLNRVRYEPVGAFIIGTKDQEQINRLRLYAVQGRLKKY